TKSKGSCSGPDAHIEEFLYRLARGDRQNDLLTQATQRLSDNSTPSTALINYFSGSLDLKAFEAAVESSKSDRLRCSTYFQAMWYASLPKDRALVKKFYEPLLKLDPLECPTYPVFARKFHPEGAQVHPPAAPQRHTLPVIVQATLPFGYPGAI